MSLVVKLRNAVLIVFFFLFFLSSCSRWWLGDISWSHVSFREVSGMSQFHGQDKSSPKQTGQLHSGHRRQQPAPTFSQPASTDCTALSTNYIRPSGFLCCRPDGLELTTDWVSRSVCRFWCFRLTVKTMLFAR